MCKAARPVLNVGQTMQRHFEEAGWLLLRSQSGGMARSMTPSDPGMELAGAGPVAELAPHQNRSSLNSRSPKDPPRCKTQT